MLHLASCHQASYDLRAHKYRRWLQCIGACTIAADSLFPLISPEHLVCEAGTCVLQGRFQVRDGLLLFPQGPDALRTPEVRYPNTCTHTSPCKDEALLAALDLQQYATYTAAEEATAFQQALAANLSCTHQLGNLRGLLGSALNTLKVLLCAELPSQLPLVLQPVCSVAKE